VRTDTSKPLRAGDLSHTGSIIAPPGTLAAEEVEVDSEVPASIVVVPVSFQSPERFAAGGLQAQTTYTVSTRYRTDVRASYVFVEDCCTQRRFEILSVVPSDRRDALDMRCVTAN
jgi:head-tail adaptor